MEGLREGLVAGLPLGEAEVDEERAATGGDDDVAGFDVAVDERGRRGVQSAEALEDAADERQGGAAGLALPFHGVAGFQELVKGLSADILHDQGAVVVREGEAVEESDDVWMVDGAEVVNLPLKRFLIRAVIPDFYGHLGMLRKRLLCEIYCSLATGANATKYFIPSIRPDIIGLARSTIAAHLVNGKQCARNANGLRTA